MDEILIFRVLVIFIIFILLQQSNLLKSIEMKIASVVMGVTMCVMLIILLVGTWGNDKIEVHVSMPSITIMRAYIEEFGKEYEGKKIPEEKNSVFWRRMLGIMNSMEEQWNVIESENGKGEEISQNEEENSILEEEFLQKDMLRIALYIKDMAIDQMLLMLGVLALIVSTYILYQISLFPRYCNHIEEQINSYGHVLMGENILEDILISINIVKENVCKKNNLCAYMRREICNNKGGIYYLLGQAGEGKTVALMQLMLMIIKERKKIILKRNDFKIKKIPIFLPIAEIDGFDDKKFEEQLCKKMIGVYLGEKLKFLTDLLYTKSKSVFYEYLKCGKFVILLDGYDEVNENKRYAFVCMLEKMIDIYPKNYLVVSSRTYVFREDNYPILHAGTVLSLTELSKEQMYGFIHRWNFIRKQPNELYHKISANPQLEYLASNALILTLICYMYEYGVQIEHNTIVDFYIEASTCLLKTWEEDKKIQKRIKLPLKVKQEALSAFAYYQLVHMQSWSRKKELVKAMKECAERNGVTPTAIIDEISLQAGILESTSRENYRFYHRSFFEFYAALYMIDENISIDMIENEAEQYCNLISFYLSLKKDTRLTTEILRRHKEKTKFVGQIIRYCEIDDNEFILEYINRDLENIELCNTDTFQRIGELARKYPYVRSTVRQRIYDIVRKEENVLTKQNCFITLAYFEDSTFLAHLMIDIFSANEIVDIILMADDTIDEVIYHLADENLGTHYLREIFDGMANAFKYDLLLRMMIGNNGNNIKELIMGNFLHCTKERIFLEWLEDKDLLQYEKKQDADKINDYARKYKWCNNEASSALVINLYVIAWHIIGLLDDESYYFELEKIDNSVKFIVTYLKNIENPIEVKNYLIDIENFEIISLTEFDYHWRRADKNKISMIGKDPVVMNYLVIIAVILSNFILMAYYLIRTVELPGLLEYRFTVKTYMFDLFQMDGSNFDGYDEVVVKISRYIEYNSLYFLIMIMLNTVQKLLHSWIAQINYKKYYLIYHFLIAMVTMNIYCLIIQEINFRRVYAGLVLFIMLIGIIQHKNNYPAFRNPEFTRIRRYLS